jgi:hypothetical protein
MARISLASLDMHRGTRSGLALVVVLTVLVTGHAAALHRNTPLFLQVGETPGSIVGGMRFSDRSNVLIFHSDADLLGNGNTVPQIFVFDLASRVKRERQGLYQLTFGNAPSLAPAAARRGRVVAFDSAADLLGTGSTGRQIFASSKVKWAKGSVPLFQVTRAGADSFGAVLSPRRGRTVIFSSLADLTAAGLGAGAHLYRARLSDLERSGCAGYPCPGGDNPGLELIAAAPAADPDIDRTGDRVVFTSSGDVAGAGCGVGRSQIFLRNFKTGTIEQLTCGSADSRHAVFTHSYHGLLFESDADLLGTGSTHTQIYHLDLRNAPYALTQMTAGTDGDSAQPSPNGTRSKVRFFFQSTANLTGGATPGTINLFQFDEDRGLVRLTDGQSLGTDVAGQFTFAAFTSDADLVGNGNHAPQLFVVNSYPLFAP